jgi:DNA-binding GntR family transcriptional regulator
MSNSNRTIDISDRVQASVLPDFPPETTDQLRLLWQRQPITGATSDMVHHVLHEAIIDTILPPGQWLGEMQLARLFDVSRTPVREALLRLEAEQLAVRIPRRGLVVSGITPKEILDVYVVRESIEGLAAYLVAQTATPAEIAELESLRDRFTDAANANDIVSLAAINLQFHETLASFSRNTLLMEFVQHIHRLVRRFGKTTFAHPGRAESASNAHRELVAAIARHDADRAMQIAKADMAVAREIRIAMLASKSPG